MDPAYSLVFKEKAFPIDIVSFQQWLASNVSNFTGLYVTPNYTLVFSAPPSSGDQTAIKTYLDGLNQGDEAGKLALPSRQVGPSKGTYDSEIKTKLLSKTWDQMSTTERKFFQGLPLTSTEYDALVAE